MPKMKTKSGAKKRFSVTATGKVKFKQAHSRHRLISKPQKMKRKARGTSVMYKADGIKVITYFLPNCGAKRRRKNMVTNDNANTGKPFAIRKIVKAPKAAAKATATKKPAAAKKAAAPKKAGE